MLTGKKIDPEALVREVSDDGAGAVALFLGTVRDNSEAGRVKAMEYEAYAGMAEKSLSETEEEVKRRWPETRGVKIIHRIGKLAIGDVSVAIAVSSPHRADAFAACRYAIERIKHGAPIWKRETLADGRQVWVEGAEMIGPARSYGGTFKKARRQVRKAKRRVR